MKRSFGEACCLRGARAARPRAVANLSESRLVCAAMSRCAHCTGRGSIVTQRMDAERRVAPVGLCVSVRSAELRVLDPRPCGCAGVTKPGLPAGRDPCQPRCERERSRRMAALTLRGRGAGPQIPDLLLPFRRLTRAHTWAQEMWYAWSRARGT